MKNRWFSVFLGMMGWLVLRRWWIRHNPMVIRDKVVIITGASSGIGWSAAHAFAQDGASVVVTSRREGNLDQLAGELRTTYDCECLSIAADITQDADRRRIIEATLDKFGRIDVLVNNAGMLLKGHCHTHTPADLEDIIATNLHAPMQMTSLVLPHMRQQRSGAIVNVSSGGGRTAPPGTAAYVATKGGLIMFSEALRREVGMAGITVSLVLPVMTYTPMVESMDDRFIKMLGFRYDRPEVPAIAIVEAVRYRRREVHLGGPLEHLMYAVARLFPGLYDIVFRLVFTEAMINRFYNVRSDDESLPRH